MSADLTVYALPLEIVSEKSPSRISPRASSRKALRHEGNTIYPLYHGECAKGPVHEMFVREDFRIAVSMCYHRKTMLKTISRKGSL
jgi:hypothetical protein